jgi:prevent-host-death family protein
MSAAIQISVRELHARTGHYVRKAGANQRVIVTDNGKPVAELKPLDEAQEKVPYFSRRKLLPGFKKIMDKCVGGTDSTQIISEDREDRYK